MYEVLFRRKRKLSPTLACAHIPDHYAAEAISQGDHLAVGAEGHESPEAARRPE